MNKKYILKGLLLVILIPLTFNYFITTPGSDVSFNTIFMLIGIPIWVNEEVKLSLDISVKRTNYQVFIDRIFIAILIAISIDGIIAFILNIFN